MGTDPDGLMYADPFRLDWAGTRGDSVTFGYPNHMDMSMVGPHREAPDRDRLPGHLNSARFESAGIDTMHVVLAESSHAEWSYVPYGTINPFCAPTCDASRYGERVAAYYTQAWFDRYLKDDTSATDRLLARTFDASVDGSSIGHGTYDPLTRTNVPYRIEGLPVRDALTHLYRSSYAFEDHVCADAREGC